MKKVMKKHKHFITALSALSAVTIVVVAIMAAYSYFLPWEAAGVSRPTPESEYGEFWIDPLLYAEFFEDDKIDEIERNFLYSNYYERLPDKFKASATHYGSDRYTYGEVLRYGEWIRQQMWRGWVLIGSGMYGYNHCYNYHPFECAEDPLLSNQSSEIYYIMADRSVDERGQPIPVAYDELNQCQRRMYDLTSHDIREKQHRATYFMSIEEQSTMTPEEALATGKYVAIVSAKSVNDFGRRFLIYKVVEVVTDTGSFEAKEFVGVVIVGGEAKRDDWTGLGSPTNDTFKFNHFPLSIRVDSTPTGAWHWAFDFPTSLYEHFGGTTGHVSGIIAVDPDEPCEGGVE